MNRKYEVVTTYEREHGQQPLTVDVVHPIGYETAEAAEAFADRLRNIGHSGSHRVVPAAK